MSQENAIKFLELTKEDSKLFDEIKKCKEGDTISYEALGKLAKEKGFECSAEDIKQTISIIMSQPDSGELDENALESVAGGWFGSDLWNDFKDWWNGGGKDKAMSAGKAGISAAIDDWNKSESAATPAAGDAAATAPATDTATK